jgi:hypothetical protein
MTRRLHLDLTPVYVLAITAVLIFGIKEATAAPAENAALACTLADHAACNEYCAMMGWGDYGRCTEYGCQCYIRMCGDAPC